MNNGGELAKAFKRRLLEAIDSIQRVTLQGYKILDRKNQDQKNCPHNMERPGIEPGTTSMLKRYHTIRPSPQCTGLIYLNEFIKPCGTFSLLDYVIALKNIYDPA